MNARMEAPEAHTPERDHTRGTGARRPQNPRGPSPSPPPLRRAALFVDHDNIRIAMERANLVGVACGFVPWPVLVRYLAERHGYSFGIRRAYGDFMTNARTVFADRVYRGQEVRALIQRDFDAQSRLLEEGFELMLSPPHRKAVKNRADILISIDMLGIASAHSHVDSFCIASGDSDFTPVVQRLKAQGKHVAVLGVRGCLSSLLEAVVDEVVYIDQDMIDWGLRDPLLHLVGDWFRDPRTRDRMFQGLPVDALVHALELHRPGVDCRWFGYPRWTDLLEDVLEGMEWRQPGKNRRFSLRLAKGRFVLSPLDKPELTTAEPDRRSMLKAALKRRHLDDRPDLRRTVVEWMTRMVDGSRERSLKDILDDCQRDLAVAHGNGPEGPSRSRIRQVVHTLVRSGAFLDDQGRPADEATSEALHRPMTYRFQVDRDQVVSNLVRLHVDALKTDPGLVAGAPLDLDDAPLVAELIFGVWDPEWARLIEKAIGREAPRAA